MRKTEQFRLPEELVEDLEAYSAASGLSKTEIVEMALKAHMAISAQSALEKRYWAIIPG